MEEKDIAVHSGNILELLASRLAGTRFGRLTADPSRPPLVLLDGVAVDGVYRLESIPSLHVLRVTVHVGSDASARYGRKANHGAIVVQTRR